MKLPSVSTKTKQPMLLSGLPTLRLHRQKQLHPLLLSEVSHLRTASPLVSLTPHQLLATLFQWMWMQPDEPPTRFNLSASDAEG
jgi:hypothetical protein